MKTRHHLKGIMAFVIHVHNWTFNLIFSTVVKPALIAMQTAVKTVESFCLKHTSKTISFNESGSSIEKFCIIFSNIKSDLI